MPKRTPLQKILESAASLFARKGFNRTTTRDIAAAAKVNQATLFRNFREGKIEIALASIAMLAARSNFALITKEAMDKCDPNSPETLVNLVEACFFISGLHPDFVGIIWRALYEYPTDGEPVDLRQEAYIRYSKPILDFLTSYCNKSIEAGKMRGNGDVNAQILFSIFLWQVQSNMLPIKQKQEKDPIKKSQELKLLAQEVMQVFLHGVSTSLPAEELSLIPSLT